MIGHAGSRERAVAKRSSNRPATALAPARVVAHRPGSGLLVRAWHSSCAQAANEHAVNPAGGGGEGLGQADVPLDAAREPP